MKRLITFLSFAFTTLVFTFGVTLPCSTSESYKYIIITNNALANATSDYTLNTLLDNRIAKGYTGTIVTVENIYLNYTGRDNPEKIRNFIKDAYQKWGTLYVLIGGDSNIVPARMFKMNKSDIAGLIPSDMYYGCLEGDFNANSDANWGQADDDLDFTYEVYIGRASAENAVEMSNFVYKTITYENSPPNASYHSKMLNWNSGESGIGNTPTWRNDWYSKSTSLTMEYCRSLPYSKLKSKLNSGNMGFYLGASHGLQSSMHMLTNAEADGFTNGDQFYLMTAISCLSGQFTANCVAEHLTTSTRTGGAFAVMLNSNFGIPPYVNQFLNKFRDLYYIENIVTLGELHAKINNVYTAAQYAADEYRRNMAYEYTLFGDPLTVWKTKYASSLVGNYPFEENTGITTQEKQGNTANAVLKNNATWFNWTKGSAIEFDGLNGYVDAGKSKWAPMGNQKDLALSAWILPYELREAGIVASGKENQSFSLNLLSDGRVSFTINKGVLANDSSSITLTSADKVIINKWTFVAATYNQLTMEAAVYIGNSKTATPNAMDLYIGYTPEPVIIGCDFNGADKYFKGVIDEVKIYNRSITSTDIANTIAAEGLDREIITNANPPTISSISNQITDEDLTIMAIPFTVFDSETKASNLVVTASSSNTTVLPNSNIIIGGNGENRTLSITPAKDQNGVAIITLTVNDISLSASQTFEIKINPINDAPKISTIQDVHLYRNTNSDPVLFTINDVDNPETSLLITISSSNEALIPQSNIVINGTGLSRNFTITPTNELTGSAIITITVSDGILLTSESFNVIVSNQVITFENIPEKTYGDANFNLIASSNSNLPISFTSDNELVATVIGNSVSIIGAGSVNIIASQAGNTEYSAAIPVSKKLIVNKANQIINFPALTTKKYGDSAFEISASSTSNLAIKFSSENVLVATISSNTLSIAGAGTALITANQYGNNNFNAASASQTLKVELQSPWLDASIGTPAITGNTSYFNNTFTINAAGIDVVGASDQCHYIYQPLNGNGEIIAKIASCGNMNIWSKAGIMIRSSLDANAAMVIAQQRPDNYVNFSNRPTDGGNCVNIINPSTEGGTATNKWLKLNRTGNVYRAYYSTVSNVGPWIAFSVASTTVVMNPDVLIGFYYVSHNASSLGTATFTDVLCINSGWTAATSEIFDMQPSINIIPNPATDIVNITLDGFSNPEIQIIDMKGIVLYRTNLIDKNKISISTNNIGLKGLYFVKVVDNNISKTTKLIIK